MTIIMALWTHLLTKRCLNGQNVACSRSKEMAIRFVREANENKCTNAKDKWEDQRVSRLYFHSGQYNVIFSSICSGPETAPTKRSTIARWMIKYVLRRCQLLLFMFFLTCFDQLSFDRRLKLILMFLYARFISGNLIMISLFLFFFFFLIKTNCFLRRKLIVSKKRWQKKIFKSSWNTVEWPAPLLRAAIRNKVVVDTVLKIKCRYGEI